MLFNCLTKIYISVPRLNEFLINYRRINIFLKVSRASFNSEDSKQLLNLDAKHL